MGRSGREQARRPAGVPLLPKLSPAHSPWAWGQRPLAPAESHASYQLLLLQKQQQNSQHLPPHQTEPWRAPEETQGQATLPSALPRKTTVQASPTSPEWPLSSRQRRRKRPRGHPASGGSAGRRWSGVGMLQPLATPSPPGAPSSPQDRRKAGPDQPSAKGEHRSRSSPQISPRAG